MDVSTRAKPRKAADIHVLRCLGQGCGGLLAYEVDSDQVLYVDLSWTARQGDGYSYFPCPKCGGKNVVEKVVLADGASRHRVARFVA
jgi:hypothetical protein